MQSNLDSDGASSVESLIYAFVCQNRCVTSGMQRDRACIRDYIFRSTAYAFLVRVFFVKQCLIEKTCTKPFYFG